MHDQLADQTDVVKYLESVGAMLTEQEKKSAAKRYYYYQIVRVDFFVIFGASIAVLALWLIDLYKGKVTNMGVSDSTVRYSCDKTVNIACYWSDIELGTGKYRAGKFWGNKFSVPKFLVLVVPSSSVVIAGMMTENVDSAVVLFFSSSPGGGWIVALTCYTGILLLVVVVRLTACLYEDTSWTSHHRSRSRR